MPKLNIRALVVIIIAVAVIFVLIFYNRLFAPQGGLLNLSPQNPGEVIVNAPPGKLVSGFELPPDWPEKDLQIIRSYAASYTTYLPQQFTLIYISKMSLDQNFASFKDYLQRHNWRVLSSDNKGNSAFLNTFKLDKQLQIAINKTPGGVQVTVSEYSPTGFK